MVVIREVAAHAGVSLGTVSRVINGYSNVSPDIRARVENSIITLGYRPNFVARSLRSRRSLSFGLVIPDVTNPFFAELVKGLEQASWKSGYTVILGNSEERKEAERVYIEMLVDRMIDGLIIVPTTETKKVAIKAKVPVVLIDRSLPGHSLVASDHRGGADAAVTHLLDLGHNRIGCIAGPRGVPVATERFEGYQQAMRRRGLQEDPTLVRFVLFDYDGGFRAATELFKTPQPPTAIFASSDQQAIGAIRAATDKGLRVPDDLSIFGVDDIPLAALINPRLSTVRQSVTDLSQTAISSLMLLRDDPTRITSHRLNTTLVLRESCGPPPAAKCGRSNGRR